MTMTMTRISLTNEELSLNLEESSPNKNVVDLQAMHSLYQSWEKVVTDFAPILAKCPLSVFISHAWHIAPKDCASQMQRDYQYYDLMDLSVAKILKLAGFHVVYDKDMTASKGIIAQGTDGFMESEVSQSDIIISFCTPLYHDRAVIQGTGVWKEVECIKKRITDFNTSSFFIPILLHGSVPNYSPEKLMVGSRGERIFNSIYLDLRIAREFISNVWKIFHRMFTNFRKKLDEFVEDAAERSVLLQQYVEVLGKLLDYDDYFDLQSQKTIRSNAKDDLIRMYNSLRIFTTVPKDINPDDLIRQLKEEMNKHAELFVASEDKDIVAFLGNTGVGKSTIINFLAGKKLTTDRLKQSYHLVDAEDSSAMRIGMGSESETIYPQSITIGKEVYFDLPGFSDSKGSVQDLVNAAFIRQVLVSARTVKIVFVVGSDEVTSQRGKVVKHLFSAIRSVFPESSVVDDSSVLIVNKSTFQFSRQADIVEYLRTKLRSAAPQNDLSNTLKLWETGNRILHLPNPSVDDISDQPGIRDTLLRVITALKPASHDSVQSFDMSKFYPTEIHFPLKNMFFQSLNLNSPSLQAFHEMDVQLDAVSALLPQLHVTMSSPVAALAQYDKIEKYFYSNQETLNKIKTIIDTYFDRNYQRLLEDIEKSLSMQREIKLLTAICQDPYNDAKKAFESLLQEKLKMLKDRVESLESKLIEGKKKYHDQYGVVLVELERQLQDRIRFDEQEGNNDGQTFKELVNPVTGYLNLSGFGIDENQLRIRIISLPSEESTTSHPMLREVDKDKVPIFPGLEVIIIPSILIDNSPDIAKCLKAEFRKISSLHYDVLLLFSSRNRYIHYEEDYRYFVIKDNNLPLSLYQMWSLAKIVSRDWEPLKPNLFQISSNYTDIKHERNSHGAVFCGACLFCGPYCCFHTCFFSFFLAIMPPLIFCTNEFEACRDGENSTCSQRCNNCCTESSEKGREMLCNFWTEHCTDFCGKNEKGCRLFPCQSICVAPCVRCCFINCCYKKQEDPTTTTIVLEKVQLTFSIKTSKPKNLSSKKTISTKVHAVLPSEVS